MAANGDNIVLHIQNQVCYELFPLTSAHISFSYRIGANTFLPGFPCPFLVITEYCTNSALWKYVDDRFFFLFIFLCLFLIFDATKIC